MTRQILVLLVVWSVAISLVSFEQCFAQRPGEIQQLDDDESRRTEHAYETASLLLDDALVNGGTEAEIAQLRIVRVLSAKKLGLVESVARSAFDDLSQILKNPEPFLGNREVTSLYTQALALHCSVLSRDEILGFMNEKIRNVETCTAGSDRDRFLAIAEIRLTGSMELFGRGEIEQSLEMLKQLASQVCALAQDEAGCQFLVKAVPIQAMALRLANREGEILPIYQDSIDAISQVKIQESLKLSMVTSLMIEQISAFEKMPECLVVLSALSEADKFATQAAEYTGVDAVMVCANGLRLRQKLARYYLIRDPEETIRLVERALAELELRPAIATDFQYIKTIFEIWNTVEIIEEEYPGKFPKVRLVTFVQKLEYFDERGPTVNFLKQRLALMR
jgi:hypothetical protein